MIDIPHWITNQRPNTIFSQVGNRTLTAPTLAELRTLYADERKAAEALYGGRLTPDQLTAGPSKPPMSHREHMEMDLRHKAELNPAPPQKTPEQQREDAAVAAADAERRDKLTQRQREAEDAKLANDAAKAKAAELAKRAKIRKSESYQRIRQRLDNLIFTAIFSPAATAQQLAELQHQSQMLEKFLDVAAVTANVAELQRAATNNVSDEQAKLRKQMDALAYRREAMADGLTFDDVMIEALGDVNYVALTVGDKTVKVTQSKYEARDSDESLKSELFI